MTLLLPDKTTVATDKENILTRENQSKSIETLLNFSGSNPRLFIQYACSQHLHGISPANYQSAAVQPLLPTTWEAAVTLQWGVESHPGWLELRWLDVVYRKAKNTLGSHNQSFKYQFMSTWGGLAC